MYVYIMSEYLTLSDVPVKLTCSDYQMIGIIGVTWMQAILISY